MKDGRLSIRLEGETYNRVNAWANSTGRTITNMIAAFLDVAVGTDGIQPCIVRVSEDSYIWASPAGTYGPLDKITFRRITTGGGVPLRGESWRDAFDTLGDAISNLGTEVCRQATGGLLVTDIDSFIALCKKYA